MLKLQLMQSTSFATDNQLFLQRVYNSKTQVDMSEIDCDATAFWSIFYMIQEGAG